MTRGTAAMLRLIGALVALLALGGCTHSLNAGDHGGIAWIFMSIMLILIGVVLWIIIGREE